MGSLGISTHTMWWVYDGDDLGSFYARGSGGCSVCLATVTVSVLNGGFPELAEGKATVTRSLAPRASHLQSRWNRSLLKTYEQVLENSNQRGSSWWIHGPKGVYLGTQSEPDAVGRCPLRGDGPWGAMLMERWVVGCLGPSLGFALSSHEEGPSLSICKMKGRAQPKAFSSCDAQEQTHAFPQPHAGAQLSICVEWHQ